VDLDERRRLSVARRQFKVQSSKFKVQSSKCVVKLRSCEVAALKLPELPEMKRFPHPQLDHFSTDQLTLNFEL
jgi:hypothetical protein